MHRSALICGVICSLAPIGFASADDDEAVDEEIVQDTRDVEQDTIVESDEAEVADDDEETPTFYEYPVRFARRPLVLSTGMVRADSRITVGGVFGSGTYSSLDLGGATSPVANLEVGLSTELTGAIPAPGGIGLISVIFSPDARYGDIPVYARYQFYEGEKGFLVGVDLVLVLPTNTDFTLTAGLPMRVLEVFGLFTMDMNLNFRYRNGDKFAVSNASANTMDFTFSGASVINVTDHGFVEIGGGVGVVNINGAAGADNVVELPFFLGGGYTLKRKVLVDLFAQFGWMPLMTAHRPPGRDTFNIGETWFVAVGATVHTKPLFGED
ncbi:MAG: hypothetical protein OEM15_06270 [Myxococcales bacterium]|nr:hypothetical protein [Myxococcales bacterium]MDH3484383.1 hypothetical protein [Myxococcales bacterium]